MLHDFLRNTPAMLVTTWPSRIPKHVNLGAGQGQRSQVAQHRVLQREVVAEAGQVLVDVSGQGEVGKPRQAGLHGEDVRSEGEGDVSEKLGVTWGAVRVHRFCAGLWGRGCWRGLDGFRGFGRLRVGRLGKKKNQTAKCYDCEREAARSQEGEELGSEERC